MNLQTGYVHSLASNTELPPPKLSILYFIQTYKRTWEFKYTV